MARCLAREPCGSTRDRRDLHAAERRAITVAHAVRLRAPVLLDVELLALAGEDDLAGHLRAGDRRRAELVADEQHAVERDLVADLAVAAVDLDHVALAHLELVA